MISVFDSPSHWSPVPIWSMYSRVKRTGYPDQELLSVYRDYGVIPKSSRDDNHNVASEDLSAYQLVEVGDLVVNKMKAWQGSFAVSTFEGIVSPAYFVYKPHHQSNNRFLHYLLRSSPYMAHYNRISSGVRIGQWDLDPAQFRLTGVPLPPLEEQTAIADFLDRELAQIDALIEKQQELLVLCEEKYQATILSCVSGSPAKSSIRDVQAGSPFSAIPSTWDYLKLGSVCKIIGGGTPTPDADNWNGEIAWATPTDMNKSENLLLEMTSRTITEVGLNSGSKLVPENSVLFSCRAPIGHVAIVKNPMSFNQGIKGLVPRKHIRAEFLALVLIASKGYLQNQGNGTTFQEISATALAAYKIPVPELKIQDQILNELDSKLSSIRETQNRVNRTTILMKERRQSLISAAVTGKIDVRMVA
jgi:type I restriction enzyme S subunit